MDQIERLLTGSIPELGSSKKTTFEFPTKAMPRESFLLFPPDKVFVSFFLSDYKLHLLIISSSS